MSAAAAIKAWLQACWPAAPTVDARERMRAVIGAGLGLLATAWLCRAWAPAAAAGTAWWLVAPLGASAVLVFAVPASPLAQPWSVVGGNTLSALVGVACVQLVPDPALAGPLATAAAIGAMFWLRCLHPPGGAMALFVVLAHVSSWSFVLFPALANSLLLVLAGMLYNSLTGRRYPHAQRPQAQPAATPERADLDAALAHYNQVLDISRDDLESLLQETQLRAYQRGLGALRCADIMSREPATVEFGSSMQEAWQLMHERRIKALPVVDRARHLVGIVTQADFFRQMDLQAHEGFGARLRRLVRASGSVMSDKPEVVGQIMTRQVRVASVGRPIVELMPLFSHEGHHHIPIIDDDRRLVGMITQSDFVRALTRAVGPAPLQRQA